MKVFRKMTEIIRCDGLQLIRSHGKHFYQNLRGFFCGVHQTKRQVKIFPGRKHTMMCPDRKIIFFISSLVATAISLPPGTIHGTTPMPAGNTTGHSVAISQSSLVKTLSSSGRTNVKAIMFVVCAWYTTRYFGFCNFFTYRFIR